MLNINNFYSFFEFFLTCTILATLKRPAIVDFGAGHSVYEDKEVEIKNKNKAGRFIKPEPKPVEPEEQIKVITVPETITIKELAEKMNVSRQAVSKWEAAQTTPDLEKILQLGNLFGVTTDYLLDLFNWFAGLFWF